MSEQALYQLEPHVCATCGGRIMRQVQGERVGAVGPIWRCADCGKELSDMGPDKICWCGVKHRGGEAGGYFCVEVSRAKDDPAMAEALSACGILPPYRVQVGVILSDHYRILTKRHHPISEPLVEESIG
jgi:DNA-directed RNA polymerase subunit RPC12/RpoP